MFIPTDFSVAHISNLFCISCWKDFTWVEVNLVASITRERWKLSLLVFVFFVFLFLLFFEAVLSFGFCFVLFSFLLCFFVCFFVFSLISFSSIISNYCSCFIEIDCLNMFVVYKGLVPCVYLYVYVFIRSDICICLHLGAYVWDFVSWYVSVYEYPLCVCI